MKKTLQRYYDLMMDHFGPTGWWPGDSAFEIAVGAILTQNTAWANVEKAIANLKKERLLSPQAILACRKLRLESVLRPSGFFRVKARRLRSFCAFLADEYGGSMKRLARRPLKDLRDELLSVHGIGPETADDIILYACEKPVFVVDAYTRRILSRHGQVDPKIGYEDLRALFEKHLERDVALYKDYHGLIVWTAKNYCRATPNCEKCPLAPTLRRGQPLLAQTRAK